MRVENWNGYDIRFVEVNGEWYAILKDICDALKLRSKDISQRLDPDMMERVPVTGDRNRPTKYKENYEDGSNDVVKSNNTFWMLAVNELGIYEALFASRRLEARKFRRWSADVMRRLRGFVGLQGYEALRLTEKDVQDKINDILDVLYWDDEAKRLMVSVTIQGGDVDQIPFDEYLVEYKQ